MSYLVKNSKNIDIHINFDMVSTRFNYSLNSSFKLILIPLNLKIS